MDIKQVIEDLKTKITTGFEAAKNSLEHFSVLQDTAAQAIKARDEAGQVILKSLDDIDAAVNEMRDKIRHDISPPAPPQPAPAPQAQ